MEQRTLGHAGPQLSVIGLGTWAIGGPWIGGWGPQDDQDSLQAIEAAIGHGCNWIDTAPAYGLGHAEAIVGRALREIKRSDIIIASKCGLVWDDRGRVKIDLRPQSIRTEIDASLRRLGIDVIDLYQHHWPDKNVPIEASWGEMIRLQQAGKVRYIGVCNYNVEQLAQCSKLQQVQSLQPPYSLLKREVEKEILPYCHSNGIGVVAYSPLQAGLLSGSFSHDRLASDDWRRRDKLFKEPAYSKIKAFVERLRPLASDRGAPVAHLAIAWVLANTAVTSAIVGARNAEQASSNAGAASFELSQADLQTIRELLQDLGQL